MKDYGKMAKILISNYPLYANTDTIDDDQAIQIALVIFDNLDDWEELCNLVS